MSEVREYRVVERRRSRGCLWGCLAVLAVLLLAAAYAAWFFQSGFRENPVARTAMELMQRDGLAQRVLGAPLTLAGVEGNAFSYDSGAGARSRTILRVEGPKGTGTLDVSSTGSGVPKIESMILTGPDGRRYDLLKDKALDGPAPIPGDTI